MSKFQYRPYSSIGQREIDAVNRVMKSGVLSGFYGSYGEHFFGGAEIKALELEWSKTFEVKHSVSVNSAASGLLAAIGALGITPGDEVILPPITMSATAMAPLIYGATPVFADIELETYSLDLESVRSKVTDKTKAIIVVNLFGHPAKLAEIVEFAHSKGIKVIEDNAQSINAKEDGRYAGTIGDIGVFSLNYHKHIHSGEGGICCTNDDNLALRMQLIRNHGENVVESFHISDISNLIGFNLRMTELTAAIAREQLKNVSHHVSARIAQAEEIIDGLNSLSGITLPKVRMGCTHSYYVLPIKVDIKLFDASINEFSEALNDMGFPNFVGYVKPLYMLPLFQKRIAIGSHGFPFNLSHVQYYEGMCPKAEMLKSLILCFEPCMYDLNKDEILQMTIAFRQVHKKYLKRL